MTTKDPTTTGVPSPRMVALALVAAAVVAVAYALSPLMVIFAATMFPLFREAVRGVSGRERRVVVGTFGMAIAVRMLALAAVYIATDPRREDFLALYGDGRFSVERSLWILNDWKGVSIDLFNWLGIYAHYGNVEYDRALALVQWFVGPSPYGLALISVAAFLWAALLLYRIVRSTYGPAAALAGLVVLLFWPTFIVWSVSILKESVHLLLSAIAVAASVQAMRVERWRQRVLLAGGAGVAVWLAAFVRGGSQTILLSVILFGCAVLAAIRRSAIAVALLVVAVATVGVMTRRPDIQARAADTVNEAVHYHVGQIESPGKSYRTADQYFYDAWPRQPAATGEEVARFLLRSAAMFIAVPLPSQVVSAPEVLVLPQHFTWLLLVPLACCGALVGLHRDAMLTGMLVGYCLIGMAIIAPFSGNIGTLIRHRDMIVPFLVWLSALGAVGGLEALARREAHATH